MKRIICMLLALMLLPGMIPFAAAEDVIFSTTYFTLTLPENWLINTDDLSSESEENFQALGYFCPDEEVGLVVVSYLVYYEDLKNVALWSSDESELQDYAEAVMADFVDDNPEWLGTVTAGKIPFVLIRGTDEDGEYLYADTITNGYAIEFLASVSGQDDRQYPITETDIEQFKQILTTFKPVT